MSSTNWFAIPRGSHACWVRRWLHEVFGDLRAFLHRAAEAGDGLVIHIS
jgi:hypothetical protein